MSNTKYVKVNQTPNGTTVLHRSGAIRTTVRPARRHSHNLHYIPLPRPFLALAFVISPLKTPLQIIEHTHDVTLPPSVIF